MSTKNTQYSTISKPSSGFSTLVTPQLGKTVKFGPNLVLNSMRETKNEK